MKIQYFSAIALAAAAALTGCQPDEQTMGSSPYGVVDLVRGNTYTVTAEGNTVHFVANTDKSVTPLWQLPDGSTSQQRDIKVDLPFAGTYKFTFGVLTPAGVLYGETDSITLEQNDFTMLDNELWSYLAGGVGKTKKWVPVDKTYSPTSMSCPVVYCNPEDVMNDQSNKTELSLDGFVPNWDPGFQSWLIPADDPYMSSYMTFGLDAAKGCTLSMVRGTAEGEEKYEGTFNFNLNNPQAPTISFNGGTFSLHNKGFDAVCDNYTKDIKIVRLTPYLLQLATMRTNSDGAWWLVWCFVAEEVANGSVQIPVEEVPVTKADVVKIEDQKVAEKLFTVVTDDATYTGASNVTYLLNDEQPYGFFWWNGANAAWEESAAEDYGKKSYYPAIEGDAADFELIFKNDGTYEFNGGKALKYTISGNTISFEEKVTFFTAGGEEVTVGEVEVVKIDSDNNKYLLAIPVESDLAGNVTRYMYANLMQKSIAAAPTGPVTVAVDQEQVQWNFGDTGGKTIRVGILNTWGNTYAVDPAKIKLKKGQKLKVTFQITSGVTWKEGAAPKAVLRHNVDALSEGLSWDGFDDPDAVALNLNGETTIELTNTTGSRVDFANGGVGGTLQVCIQIDSNNAVGNDLCTIDLNDEGDPAITGTVKIVVE